MRGNRDRQPPGLNLKSRVKTSRICGAAVTAPDTVSRVLKIILQVNRHATHSSVGLDKWGQRCLAESRFPFGNLDIYSLGWVKGEVAYKAFFCVGDGNIIHVQGWQTGWPVSKVRNENKPLTCETRWFGDTSPRPAIASLARRGGWLPRHDCVPRRTVSGDEIFWYRRNSRVGGRTHGETDTYPTWIISRPSLTSCGRSLTSLRLCAGSNTVLTPARRAPISFSLMPPTAVTRPRNEISP